MSKVAEMVIAKDVVEELERACSFYRLEGELKKETLLARFDCQGDLAVRHEIRVEEMPSFILWLKRCTSRVEVDKPVNVVEKSDSPEYNYVEAWNKSEETPLENLKPKNVVDYCSVNNLDVRTAVDEVLVTEAVWKAYFQFAKPLRQA